MPAIVSSSLVRDWAERALSGLGDARVGDRRPQRLPGARRGHRHQPVPDDGVRLPGRRPVLAARRRPTRGRRQAARAMSIGALMGARGNSGVILSQILRGTSEILGGLTDGEPLDGSAVQRLPRPGCRPRLRGCRPAGRGHRSSPWPGRRPMRPRAWSRTGPPTRRRRGRGRGPGRPRRAGADPRPCSSRCDWRASSTPAAEGWWSCSMPSPRSSPACGARARDVGLHAPLPRPVEAEASHHYGGPAYEVMFLLEADDDRRAGAAVGARRPRRQPRGRGRRPAVERPRARRRRRRGGRGGDGGRAGRTACASPTSSRRVSPTREPVDGRAPRRRLARTRGGRPARQRGRRHRSRPSPGSARRPLSCSTPCDSPMRRR